MADAQRRDFSGGSPVGLPHDNAAVRRFRRVVLDFANKQEKTTGIFPVALPFCRSCRFPRSRLHMRPCDVHADHRVQCLPFGGDRVDAVVYIGDFRGVRLVCGAVKVVGFDAAQVFGIGEYEFDYGVCHGFTPSLIKFYGVGLMRSIPEKRYLTYSS